MRLVAHALQQEQPARARGKQKHSAATRFAQPTEEKVRPVSGAPVQRHDEGQGFAFAERLGHIETEPASRTRTESALLR